MSQEKRFFIRRFRKMFLMMLLPAMILFVMTFAMTSRSIDGEIRLQAGQSVNSVEENLKLVMGNVFQQNAYLTNMARMTAALRRALYGNEINYSDTIYMRSLQSLFMSMKNAYEYIDSALVYYEGGTRYISEDFSIHILEGTEDESWLDLYRNMPEAKNSVIGLRTLSENTAAENQVLTMCQRLLMQQGCIVIDLKLTKLQNMLDTFATVQGQVIYLLNTNGEIMARSSEDRQGFDIESYVRENGGMDWFLAQERSWWAKAGYRKESLICVLDHGDPGIVVVSVTPRSAFFSKVYSELHFFMLVVLMDFVIVAFLAYSTTKQSFRHIRIVMWMFEQAEQGKIVTGYQAAAKDEYDVIMNNIVRMFLNTTYLNTQLKEKQYREENAELRSLQLQINPHFLFNTLQTLDLEAGSIDRNGSMHRIIRFLSEILKYALEDPHKTVTLQEELNYLKKYVAVQSYRFGDRFIIYYNVDEDIVEAPVFRMMLQPVLENSLLHGLRNPDGERGYINVDIDRNGEWIEIAVADTGAGMSAEQLREVREKIADPESKSIGLTNLNRRLQLYYGEACMLHIESVEGEGTKVSFCIPIHKV